jgi:hypothetical protein
MDGVCSPNPLLVFDSPILRRLSRFAAFITGLRAVLLKTHPWWVAAARSGHTLIGLRLASLLRPLPLTVGCASYL